MNPTVLICKNKSVIVNITELLESKNIPYSVIVDVNLEKDWQLVYESRVISSLTELSQVISESKKMILHD